MQAESLEVLEKAEVPPAQARAIVRAIEIELAGAKDTLATKHDILLQRQDFYQESGKLRQQMIELRADLEAQMTKLRADLEGQMTQLRTNLEGQMTQLRAHVEGQIAGLRADVEGHIVGLRADFQSQMAEMRGELRAEIHGSVSGVTRQMYTALLGQTAVLLGFAYFFATHIA
jgi:hypothetical protein